VIIANVRRPSGSISLVNYKLSLVTIGELAACPALQYFLVDFQSEMLYIPNCPANMITSSLSSGTSPASLACSERVALWSWFGWLRLSLGFQDPLFFVNV
jgi:hypothetical protein